MTPRVLHATPYWPRIQLDLHGPQHLGHAGGNRYTTNLSVWAERCDGRTPQLRPWPPTWRGPTVARNRKERMVAVRRTCMQAIEKATEIHDGDQSPNSWRCMPRILNVRTTINDVRNEMNREWYVKEAIDIHQGNTKNPQTHIPNWLRWTYTKLQIGATKEDVTKTANKKTKQTPRVHTDW